MYEDFVDALCAAHAIAHAESLYGRSWGTLSQIEWISLEGKHRISKFPKSCRFLPDGKEEPSRMPQL